jgi:holo-[acyl-carrier protein] synthase
LLGVEVPRASALRILVGVDIVAVDRVANLMSRGGNVEGRLFTAGELEYCLARARRHEHLAARVAAKEAVFKVFGAGVREPIRWTDVEVVSGDGGRPRVLLHGKVAARAAREQLVDMDISLSHTEEFAIAYAVALCERAPEGAA